MGGFFFCSCWLHISPECGIVIKGAVLRGHWIGNNGGVRIHGIVSAQCVMEFATIVFVTGFVSGEDSKE